VFRRFIGWSTNPNQFALMCTVLVLLSLHLAETAARPGAQLLGLTCVIPALLAGVLTRSDSLILAMLVAGPTFLGIKLFIWAFWPERRPPLRTTVACLVLLSVPGVLASIVPFTPDIAERVEEAAIATMEQNDQAEGRFRLWRDAVDVGLESGMLGLGPGPHLVTKRWKMPPPLKNEAHNTLLDLFTQGGLLATVSFLWITGASAFVTYRANFIWLAALVFALFVFSSFHLIARHPAFWFSVAFCLTAAPAARRTLPDPGRTYRDLALDPAGPAAPNRKWSRHGRSQAARQRRGAGIS
jgi:O-antigen ligase